MAASQIPLTSQLVRQDNADFPVAADIDLAGGLMSVADIPARDAIAITQKEVKDAKTASGFCYRHQSYGGRVFVARARSV